VIDLEEKVAEWFSNTYGFKKVDNHDRNAARRLLTYMQLELGIVFTIIEKPKENDERKVTLYSVKSSTGEFDEKQ
jgi:hypothetical protein